MTKDLGTYHLKVELEDGRGWIETWNTGRRYTNGTENWHPLNAIPIEPPFENEEDLVHSMKYQYTEGNYSCDCNKALFWAYSQQKELEEEDVRCGETMPLKRLTAIRPDGTEKVLYVMEGKG